MGFDDAIFDENIEAKTKKILGELVGQYDYETWDDLDAMETGDKVYCAYSLIWRQLYNINLVMIVGACPVAPPPEMIAKMKLRIRKEVLEMFIEEMGGDWKHFDKVVQLWESTPDQ